jgi:Uma2 family endonuclease
MAVSEAPKPSPQSPRLWPLSVQAYRTLGEVGLLPKNTELLYGQVFYKMSKSPVHSALVGRLLPLLQQVLPPGFVLRTEQPITCEDYSEPEPDVAVIQGTEEDFWEEHPKAAELVIEVCATSHDYDRSKLRAYADAGVKEVWLLLVPEKQAEVYLEPASGKFLKSKTYGPGGTLISTTVPHFSLDLDKFFQKG